MELFKLERVFGEEERSMIRQSRQSRHGKPTEARQRRKLQNGEVRQSWNNCIETIIMESALLPIISNRLN